jgi:hypothetical protein
MDVGGWADPAASAQYPDMFMGQAFNAYPAMAVAAVAAASASSNASPASAVGGNSNQYKISVRN